MNWAVIAKDFPMAHSAWIESGLDIWEWVKEKGIYGYIYDPSITGQGYFWEVKYMDLNWHIVSSSDVVLTTIDHAYERMMWRIFWIIDNKESITMEDYKKADEDFTPEDWEQAAKDVEKLMNKYTKTAIARHKRKNFFKNQSNHRQ